MAIAGACHLQALAAALFVLAALAADHVEGRHHKCPSFSCGHLRDVSSPFRRAGDPPWCGSQSYELACSDTKAAIRIDNSTYYVKEIDYSGEYFWVVDSSLDNSSCPPLPRWSRLPYDYKRGVSHHNIEVELAPETDNLAIFVGCRQEMKNNGMYKPVACLSTTNYFVYVLTGLRSNDIIESLEPSCGYLAMTPLGHSWQLGTPALKNASYVDVVKSMRIGFAVQFPFFYRVTTGSINGCLMVSIGYLHDAIMPTSSTDHTIDRIVPFTKVDAGFWECLLGGPSPDEVTYYSLIVTIALWIVKWIAVLCRFMLAPLVALTFLAHKYWKTRLAIDAVEKFLRMQQMLGPTRYAYTDMTAMTSHFRDKLGQGGYGSVYKGVLLPGKIHVAVKMLNVSSNCNGEEFISEVSTIGRIHHVNVVRLVGFCSEEMRRALVYEYMSRGSLDKYIFSSEKSFSWDKLNQIALGIARGIDYLHHGCDMQILHFDIKTHNILLDDNFVPKVADFGLARLYPRNKSFVSERALRGTIGYIAPEMISRSFGVISSKSDVYSFGMLLLEVAGGRRNANPNAVNSSQAYYPSRVYSQLTRRETVDEITDAVDMHELEKKLCIVGLWCIQMKSCDRPTMSEVIEMLQGGVDILEMPARPFFCDDEHIPTTNSYHMSSEISAISEKEEEEGNIYAFQCELN